MKLRFPTSPAIASLVIFTCVRLTVVAAADTLTQHYDNARTGANLTETALTTAAVRSSSFGKLWTLFADGQISAQPLYVSALGVDTTGNNNTPLVKGRFNAVIIATMHNTVYVYDADKENRGPDGRTTPLWATWLGPPRPGSKSIDMWSTNDPEWGILSTPVVSPDKETLFVVAWHDDGPAGFAYRLHALNLRNGAHRRAPVVIGVPSSDSSQPCKPQNLFNPCTHKQRAALLLDGGVIYVGFGGDGNRGSLFAFDAQTLAQRAVWHTTPNGRDGGIWQSGQGPAADTEGNIYVMTGNGTFDTNTNGRRNFGNSFVKLKLEGSNFVVKDFFTPCNQDFLNRIDLDLGSGGPLLVPDTPPRLVSGGKEGVMYVLSRTNMGGFADPNQAECRNTNIVQQVLAFDPVVHANETHYGNIHGSPVFWKGPDTGRIYAWGENNPLKAFKFAQGKFQDVDHPALSGFRPPEGMPGGMLAVSANGNKAGTGIVWAVVPVDGDANQQRGVKGIILALDAQDVTRTLWTSEQAPQRDRLGLFPKFVPPTIANGKVFVATYGDDEPRRVYGDGPTPARPTTFPKNYYVAVYGLLRAPIPSARIVNQNSDDVTVVRASTSTPFLFTAGQCTALDAGAVDCTDALTRAVDAPVLYRVILPANQDLSGCALLRVTTASKDGGLAATSGIGFWSAQAADGNQTPEDSGRFVRKADLKAVGTATLLNGAPATLHEFVGVANCPAPGNVSVVRLFKPYMQFEGAGNGRIVRNWDVAENYRISRDVLQFDRSADVLRQ
jgi:hypothetical protein